MKLGVRVIVLDVNPWPKSMESSPLLTFFQGDVSNLQFIQETHQDLERRKLLPTILVNNAAIQNGCKTLDQLDYNEMER